MYSLRVILFIQIEIVNRNLHKLDNTSSGQVLERLKAALKVSTDSELAEATQTNRQTLGNWRLRQSIPYSLCVKTAQSKNISLDWLLAGEGPMQRLDGGKSQVEDFPNPQERSILSLYRSLSSEDQQAIHQIVSEKKRLREVEKRLEELLQALATSNFTT